MFILNISYASDLVKNNTKSAYFSSDVRNELLMVFLILFLYFFYDREANENSE
jgi:hypothetical protein